jgi:hypothetical protein
VRRLSFIRRLHVSQRSKALSRSPDRTTPAATTFMNSPRTSSRFRRHGQGRGPRRFINQTAASPLIRSLGHSDERTDKKRTAVGFALQTIKIAAGFLIGPTLTILFPSLRIAHSHVMAVRIQFRLTHNNLTVGSVSFTVIAWHSNAKIALMIHHKYRMLSCGRYD